MTNGDKIRAMSDKELAAYIAGEVLGLKDIMFAISAEAWFWKFQQGDEPSSCDECRWRNRHQRCSCCRRNPSMKDNYEKGGDGE